VDALLEHLARLDLQVAVVAPPDPTRRAARDRAQDAAITHGRKAVLDEAAAAARDLAMRAFARYGFHGTWAFTEMGVSVVNAQDRVSAAAAFEEAAMAAVVEDLVDDETVDALRATTERLREFSGLLPPGSIAAVGRPGLTIGGPLALALLCALIVLLFLLGLGTLSFVTLALAIALLAALVRRRRPSDS
jgi:hypothetical protein